MKVNIYKWISSPSWKALFPWMPHVKRSFTRLCFHHISSALMPLTTVRMREYISWQCLWFGKRYRGTRQQTNDLSTRWPYIRIHIQPQNEVRLTYCSDQLCKDSENSLSSPHSAWLYHAYILKTCTYCKISESEF